MLHRSLNSKLCSALWKIILNIRKFFAILYHTKIESQSIYNQKLYNKINSKTYFIQTRSYPTLRIMIVATSINVPNRSCKALCRGNSFIRMTDIYFIHLLITQEMFCKIHRNRRIVDCITLINSIMKRLIPWTQLKNFFYRNSFEMRHELTLSSTIRF